MQISKDEFCDSDFDNSKRLFDDGKFILSLADVMKNYWKYVQHL